MIKLKGIDISNYNTGLDYTTMAKSLDFVIPQCSYGTTRNPLFLTHVNGFKAARVKIPAVYHFIYALNIEQARQNAKKAIACVEEAGLPKDTYIWADFEYDSVNYASKRGVTLTAKECDLFTRAFCEVIEEAGYKTGIYTNQDYYKHMYTKETLAKYPLWLCDLNDTPAYDCLVWQYNWKGKIAGYDEDLDLDYWFMQETEKEDDTMTETQAINKVLDIAEAEVGYREKASNTMLDSKTGNIGSANYTKYGRDMHNIQPGNMDFPAAWCDAFVDWCFYKAFGVSLAKQILCGDFDDYTINSANYYKRVGRWLNAPNTPKRGYQIFFKNSYEICHTGLVYKVENGYVYTIEGNRNNSVCKSMYALNDSYIAGYGLPRYSLVVVSDDPIDIQPPKEVTDELVQEVINGKWGNGEERRQRLISAGYDYDEVQKKVNETLNRKSIRQIAEEVINGKWGNGEERKRRLTAAGYDYNKVQAEVNRLLS